MKRSKLNIPFHNQPLTNNRYTTLTVLIVDNHLPMQQIIKSLLIKIGFVKVFTVRDGRSAFNVIENHNVDLIVSDWNMPKMNGLELLQAIRKNSDTANIPFIMITANVNQDDVKQAVLSGVSEYLIKPFNSNTLKIKISRAFSSPIHNISFTSASSKSSSAESTKSPHSILIVDDEPNNITVLTGLLKENYNLQACLSGAKALEICNKEQLPDLILLDIMMPKMDGLAVCQKLKDNPLTEHIPIIFISALSQTKDVVKGLSMGAVDYISKPITPEITLARIKTHIKQVQQRENMVTQLDTMIENKRLKEDIERIIYHDIKEPLSAIISTTEFIKQKQSYSKQEVELITKSAYKIQKKIDEQMIIHQLENDTTKHDITSINVLEMFNKIVYRQKEVSEKNNVFVQYKIAKSINLLGDQFLCFHLFTNLLVNAIEASPINGEVIISQEVSSGFIIFNIHNQGLIPEKIQARFFDKFITEGKESGTGLGTYSAKLSALAQGGDISFFSTMEKGTTLTVTLKVGP